MGRNLFSRIIIVACLVLPGSILNAQDKAPDKDEPGSYIGLSWQPSVPLSGSKDWINAGTATGITLQGSAFITNNFAVGAEISDIYTYKRYSLATYKFEIDNFEGAITGVQMRSSNLVPILFKCYYYINSDSPIRPYFSLGAGLCYSENQIAVGTLAVSDDSWGFGANGEVGAQIILPGEILAVQTGIKYNYAKINSILNKKDNLTQLHFNLGLSAVLYK